MGESDRAAELRQLPSVDRLLQSPEVAGLVAQHGHRAALEALRRALDGAREEILSGGCCPSSEHLTRAATQILKGMLSSTLVRVINATGVILHTNLGRAPLSEDARAAMAEAARGYNNLEFDLDSGERGSRYEHATRLLADLTGAQAALVVNNNAAAVLICLAALARGREVVVSRGQLVEIGGGFRIPDVMRQSGCRLVEVGTTNRTHRRDYEEAVSPETALLLRVHTSNYRVIGFTHSVALEELAELSRARAVPLMDDLGSGALLDTAQFGLAHEPTVQESVATGADLVSFSGDKLLGGPQAGVIVGRADLVAALQSHPLTRALRVDKVTLAGLEATLRHYLKGEALEKVPVWRMIATPLAEIESRAGRWADELRKTGLDATVAEGRSTVGGGSLPGETLPSALLALRVASPDALARALRLGEQAVVARIEEDTIVLDPRTVQPDEDKPLVSAISAATVWAAPS